MRVDDTMVERTILRIAQENKLTPDEFRKVLERENIPYAKYREDIRKRDRSMQRAARARGRQQDQRHRRRGRQLSRDGRGAGRRRDASTCCRTSSCRVPEQASADQIEARRKRAEEALRAGQGRQADSREVAAAFSDAPDATSGRQPRLAHAGAAADGVRRRHAHDEEGRRVAGAAQSRPASTSSSSSTSAAATSRPSSTRRTRATSSIKVNESTSEAEGKAKIDRLRERIVSGGAKFDGSGARQFRGRVERQGRRSRLGLARRHRARVRAGDEQAQDRRGFGAGAHAVRLAPDPGASSGASRTSRRSAVASRRAHAIAAAQERRAVPGIRAPDARPRLRRVSHRRPIRRGPPPRNTSRGVDVCYASTPAIGFRIRERVRKRPIVRHPSAGGTSVNLVRASKACGRRRMHAVADQSRPRRWPRFHQWRIDEIYSNASGSVQFIDLKLRIRTSGVSNSSAGTASW